MTNSLLRFKKNQKYIVFDFETEGLNLRYSRPWQLGFIETEGQNIKNEHDIYIGFDDLSVSADAARITGFSEHTYRKKKKDKLQVLEFFDKFLYNPDYLIIGHNIIGYDVYIHNVLRKACGKPTDYSYMNRVIDTNCLSKAYKMGLKKVDDNLTLWQYKLNNYIKKGLKTSQITMLKEFSIPFEADKLHDAVYDVKMTLKLFHKLIWNIEV
jgi:DNA polymerase III epsilon subunit-like protein|tara:strand:+ start:441 stop:1073 length:633 start_codon:yes stop_codon:yes gene_type:complete